MSIIQSLKNTGRAAMDAGTSIRNAAYMLDQFRKKRLPRKEKKRLKLMFGDYWYQFVN